MKIQKAAIYLLFIASSFIFLQCTKDEPEVKDVYFSVFVNGTTWETYNCFYHYHENDVDEIIAVNGDETIMLYGDFSSPKSYDLSMINGGFNSGATNLGTLKRHVIAEGDLVISSFDNNAHRVTGIVDFKAVYSDPNGDDQEVIVKGDFSLRLYTD